MEQIKALVWIYKTCLIRTVELVRENLGIIFAPIAYGFVLSAAALLIAPLGFIGGGIFWVGFAGGAGLGPSLFFNVCLMRSTTFPEFSPRVHRLYMGRTYASVHLLDPHEAPGPVRVYNAEWPLALPRSSDPFVRNFQRCTRTHLSGSRVGIGAVVG